ncbi:hypothetical protein EKH55_5675 (plasmid) [Sinorhizobium alkalisoli]|nr:hypothetical protein EKH55_5675 [Sinorhizobium alkalisoli]
MMKEVTGDVDIATRIVEDNDPRYEILGRRSGDHRTGLRSSISRTSWLSGGRLKTGAADFPAPD